MTDQSYYRCKLKLEAWFGSEQFRYKSDCESESLFTLGEEVTSAIEAALSTCLGVGAPSTDDVALVFCKDHELELFSMLKAIRDFAADLEQDLLEAIQIHVDWNKLNPNPNERELNAKQQATYLGALTLQTPTNQEQQP